MQTLAGRNKTGDETSCQQGKWCGTRTNIKLDAVALHEVGHVIGFSGRTAHTRLTEDVMYCCPFPGPYYYRASFKLSSNDKARGKTLVRRN